AGAALVAPGEAATLVVVGVTGGGRCLVLGRSLSHRTGPFSAWKRGAPPERPGADNAPPHYGGGFGGTAPAGGGGRGGAPPGDGRRRSAPKKVEKMVTARQRRKPKPCRRAFPDSGGLARVQVSARIFLRCCKTAAD